MIYRATVIAVWEEIDEETGSKKVKSVDIGVYDVEVGSINEVEALVLEKARSSEVYSETLAEQPALFIKSVSLKTKAKDLL